MLARGETQVTLSPAIRVKSESGKDLPIVDACPRAASRSPAAALDTLDDLRPSPYASIDSEALELDLLEVESRIMGYDVEIQLLSRQPSDRGERHVGGDHAIGLRDEQIRPRIE